MQSWTYTTHTHTRAARKCVYLNTCWSARYAAYCTQYSGACAVNLKVSMAILVWLEVFDFEIKHIYYTAEYMLAGQQSPMYWHECMLVFTLSICNQACRPKICVCNSEAKYYRGSLFGIFLSHKVAKYRHASCA